MNVFKKLETQLNLEVLERNEEIHTAILALIAKRHHVQIGPPGTAKSLLVTRLVSKISDLPPDGFFHYLLTQFTVPSELYGPPNLQDMRERGIYKLNTDNKLPRAYIAFLDEIFKGNSSILNANLTIMNERKFFNADSNPDIPLMTMFAASNELPQGLELEALWDRLHFRHEIEPLQQTSSFTKMLEGAGSFDTDPIISMKDILKAQAEAAKIPLSPSVYDTMVDLRAVMLDEGIEVTERRWMDCIPIMKAEAWLMGSDTVDILAMRPLMHVLWKRIEDRKKVERLVLDISNPVDKEATVLLDKLNQLNKQLTEALSAAGDRKLANKLGVETEKKLKQATKQYEDLVKRDQENGNTSLVLPKLKKQLAETSAVVVQKIFGFSSDGVTKNL